MKNGFFVVLVPLNSFARFFGQKEVFMPQCPVSIPRSATVWCEQIQDNLAKLISANLRVSRIIISLPRNIYYAIMSNKSLLQDHYSFLNHPLVTIRGSSSASDVSGIRFAFETLAISPGSPDYFDALMQSPIEKLRPQISFPKDYLNMMDNFNAIQRGEYDEYIEQKKQQYIQECKEKNIEPQYK